MIEHPEPAPALQLRESKLFLIALTPSIIDETASSDAGTRVWSFSPGPLAQSSWSRCQSESQFVTLFLNVILDVGIISRLYMRRRLSTMSICTMTICEVEDDVDGFEVFFFRLRFRHLFVEKVGNGFNLGLSIS